MNKYTLLAMVFLLTGCPGPMDAVPVEEAAQVRLVSNQVCITTPASTGEKIFSVNISNGAGQEIYKTFGRYVQQPVVVQGKCLPAFGFEFKPGNRYAAFYQIEKNTTEPGKTYVVRFSLEQDENGSLRLIPYGRNN
ncbi:putative T6SS immunity periplasmic lipoprotein [Cronobacter turicensis]